MAQNMYRVGDYVYFEAQPAAPFHIRRIEELNKTSTGAVEAKVTCFFRRRDLPDSILKIADQAERQNKILSKPRRTLLDLKESISSFVPVIEANGGESKSSSPKENGLPESSTEAEAMGGKKEIRNHPNNDNNDEEKVSSSTSATSTFPLPKCYGFAGLPQGASRLNCEHLNELRQKELFLSRVVETLPATQIRGKCSVVILNEVETCDMYIGRDDSFFYSLVYDPSNQTLLADKGRIEIGNRHQAVIPDLLNDKMCFSKNNKICEEGEIMECDESTKEAEKMDEVVNESNGHETIKEKENFKEVEDKKTFKKGKSGVPNFIFEGETKRERCVYHPYHHLNDLEIDQFLLIARAVGTFSRALDSSSATKLPTLHQTASAASRDITLLHAMALLHQADYDMGKVVAAGFLVPSPDKESYPFAETDKLTANNTSILGGPILCRDQLEEWSASESTLFEDAIEKYGKDFHDIRLDCVRLPWKAMRDIVEYYYMWKTTSRYAELQKSKHAEQENKLKQVYIPNYNKPSINLINSAQTPSECIKSNYPCEGCNLMEAYQWYFWGPANQLRLCGDCWNIWKKRGGLTNPHELDTFDLEGLNEGRNAVSSGQSCSNRQASNTRNCTNIGQQQSGIIQKGVVVEGGGGIIPSSISGQIIMGQKGRVAFCLNAPLETRIARRIAPRQIFNVRKAARAPFFEFDLKTVQDYYFCRPLTDILMAARQVGHGTISRSAIEYLSKLHQKRTVTANGGK